MNFHECNLNIRFDLSKKILGKLETVYAQMDGCYVLVNKVKDIKIFPIGLVIMKIKVYTSFDGICRTSF